MPDHDDIFPEVPEFKSPPPPSDESQTESPKPIIPGDDNLELTDEEITAAFRRDLIYLIPPFRSFGEAATVGCVAILFTLMPFLELMTQMCCVLWLVTLGILGSLASFFFTILTDTTRGNYGLPYMNSLLTTIVEDFWDGIFIPISNFYIASLYAFIPSIVVSLVYTLVTQRATGPAEWPLPVFLALLSLGALFVPVVMLALARNRVNLLFRPIVLVKTMFKLGQPYLIGWLCIEFSLLVSAVIYLYSPRMELNLSPKTFMILMISMVDICIWIYTMRVFGLLNRYYRHRLPWYD